MRAPGDGPARLPDRILFGRPSLAPSPCVLVKVHQPSAPPPSSRGPFSEQLSAGSMRYELDNFVVIVIAITRWLEGDSSIKDEGSASPTAEVRQFQTDALPAPVHLPSVIGSADG